MGRGPIRLGDYSHKRSTWPSAQQAKSTSNSYLAPRQRGSNEWQGMSRPLLLASRTSRQLPPTKGRLNAARLAPEGQGQPALAEPDLRMRFIPHTIALQSAALSVVPRAPGGLRRGKGPLRIETGQ